MQIANENLEDGAIGGHTRLEQIVEKSGLLLHIALAVNRTAIAIQRTSASEYR